MLSRRSFVACALCTLSTGFTAVAVDRVQPAGQTSGVTRKILSTEELPGG
ncbi:hypothetical protein [Methylobacterium sp. SI9]